MMLRLLQSACASLLALLLAALPAAAQCAMCAKSVAAGGTRVIDVIKTGIYVMLVPTVLIMCIIALLVYRRRSAPRDPALVPLPPLPEFPAPPH